MAKLALLLDADASTALVAHRNKGFILHWACQTAKLNLIKKIAGACPEAVQKKDTSGKLPIHISCELGDATPIAAIRDLVQVYPDACLAKDCDGNTPLHSACKHLRRNRAEVVKLLLEVQPRAAEVKDNDGNLAVHSACEQQRPCSEAIMLLAEAYPKGLEIKDREKNIPLHSCIKRGDMLDVEVVRAFLQMYPGGVREKDNEVANHLSLHAHSASSILQRPFHIWKIMIFCLCCLFVIREIRPFSCVARLCRERCLK